MNVAELLRVPAGSRTALVFGDRRWTYGELDRRSGLLAAGLEGLGVEEGDRVALLALNGYRYWETYFACAKLGAIVVRLNFRLAAPELTFVLADAQPRVLIHGSEFIDTLTDVQLPDRVESLVYIGSEGLTGAIPYDHCLSTRDLEGMSPGGDIPLSIIYTSGTTGRPKGAVLTHANTLWFSLMQVSHHGYQNDDVLLTTGPMFHVGALEDFALPTLNAGGTVVTLRSRDFGLENVIDQVEREHVTSVVLFPFMLEGLVSGTVAEGRDFSSVRRVFSGGDPVPQTLDRMFRSKLPGIDLIQVYGLTEGTPIVAASRGECPVAENAIGPPLPNVRIRVVDDDGNDVAPGEVGELWTRSPAVSAGFWRNAEATSERFRGGWCHTGDLGRIADGVVYLAGRKKDMVRTKGENVYPAEVENVLLSIPKLADAAVFGLPDVGGSEIVAAALVTEPGEDIDEAEVQRFCRSLLAGYKCPRLIWTVDELPRTSTGKVMKHVLNERYTQVLADGACR